MPGRLEPNFLRGRQPGNRDGQHDPRDSTSAGIPPSYPGRGFFHLAAPGVPSHEGQSFSAVLAASVSVMLFLFLRDALKVSTPLAALFGLFWVTGATTFPAALSAKTGVYHLTALFLLAVFWCLFKEKFEEACFLLGLSLAHHWMSMAVFLPGLVWMALVLGRKTLNPEAITGFPGPGPGRFFRLPLPAVTREPGHAFELGRTLETGEFRFQFRPAAVPGRRRQRQPPRLDGPVVVLPETGFYRVLPFALFRARRPHLSLPAASLARAVHGLRVVPDGRHGGGLPQPSPDRFYLVGSYVLPTHLFILLFAGSAWGVELALRDWKMAEKSGPPRTWCCFSRCCSQGWERCVSAGKRKTAIPIPMTMS